MTYRSDKDAKEFRQTALEKELQEIRDALDPLSARAEILEEDLESMRREAPQAKSRSILDETKIANPCPKDWNEMKGDDKVRFCGGCKKNVFNVIAMTRVEAEELLTGGEACMRLFRRPDGTVMTSDCAPGRWRRRGQKVAVAAAAAGLAATAAYGASRLAHESEQHGTGGMAPPDAYMQQVMGTPPPLPPTPSPQHEMGKPKATTGVVVMPAPPPPPAPEVTWGQWEMKDVKMPQPLMGRMPAPKHRK